MCPFLLRSPIERHSEPLDLIHNDICDLKFIQTRSGNKYFITFVDDSTKYYYVYLLKSKDEVIEKFVLYKNEVENQFNKKIKVEIIRKYLTFLIGGDWVFSSNTDSLGY